MHRRITLFALSFLVSSILPAQNMLEEGTQWIFEYRSYVFGLPIYTETIESITVGGDTIINSKQYKKLTATQDAPCLTFRKKEYLREEGNKIYRLNQSDSTEFTMIDFDDTLGYEMPYNGFGSPDDTAFTIIDSFGVEMAFDGTPFNVQYMRIMNNGTVKDDALYKVFEKIGFYGNHHIYESGLLFPTIGAGLCDVQESAALRCHIQGQDTVRFTEFDCFESSIPNAVWENGISAIYLSPNPTTGHVEIPYDLKVERIFNLEGTEQKFTSRESSVSLEHAEPGIYILILTNHSGTTFFGRIVKL
jgi:hypothetical protein